MVDGQPMTILESAYRDGREAILKGEEEPDVVQFKKLRDLRSTLHVARISGLIARNDTESIDKARELLSQGTEGDDPIIPFAAAEQLRARLEVEEVRLKSIENADVIVAKYMAGEITHLQAIEEEPKKFKGAERDATATRVKNRISDIKATQDAQYAETLRDVKKSLRAIIPPGPATLPKITPEVESLIDEQKARVQAHELPQVNAYIERLILDDTPTAATNAAMTKFGALSVAELGDMTEAEFEKLFQYQMTDRDYLAAQDEHRQVRAMDPTAIGWKATRTNFINSLSERIEGIAGKRAGKKDTAKAKALRATLQTMLDNEFNLRRDAKKGPLTPFEMNDIINDFSKLGIEPSWAAGWPSADALIFKLFGEKDVPYWEAALEAQRSGTPSEWRESSTRARIDSSPDLKLYYEQIWLPTFKRAHPDRDPSGVELFMAVEGYQTYAERRAAEQEATQ
jgi:hypothetical protein